jgi:hypothetical protein
MKITKSELKQMIREALREELSKKSLTEALTEADFDVAIGQLKKDLLKEITPTPVVEVGEFYDNTDEDEPTFKDVYVSWEQWDETNYRKSEDFDIAYRAVVDWVERNVNKYSGFTLNVLEPVSFFGDYFITINVIEE